MKETLTPTNDWIGQQARCFGIESLPSPPVIWRDTTNYMSIGRDHVIELEGDFYLVRCDEREGRFSVEDQPKFWVKRALNLTTGRPHILKLVCEEAFKIHVGSREVRCVRSAEKEGRVLQLVQGDMRFMQGHVAMDSRGNLVRVIELISGVDLLTYLNSLPAGHQRYFETMLPDILGRVAENISALRALHEAGLCHGDIRNDHLLVEHDTGCYKWIDFDLMQESPDFDIWSIGNVLHCVLAKGFLTFQDAVHARPELSGKFSEEDASVFFPYRVMNLRKAYGYVPAILNSVLLRFSVGAPIRYDNVAQITDDLYDCAASLGWHWSKETAQPPATSAYGT